jgi:hypothetical protein
MTPETDGQRMANKKLLENHVTETEVPALYGIDSTAMGLETFGRAVQASGGVQVPVEGVPQVIHRSFAMERKLVKKNPLTSFRK